VRLSCGESNLYTPSFTGSQTSRVQTCPHLRGSTDQYNLAYSSVNVSPKRFCFFVLFATNDERHTMTSAERWIQTRARVRGVVFVSVPCWSLSMTLKTTAAGFCKKKTNETRNTGHPYTSIQHQTQKSSLYLICNMNLEQWSYTILPKIRFQKCW
jgi:TctA family transporter